MKHKAIAIGGKHKGNVQGSGVVEGLLHAVTDSAGVLLGFDERDAEVGFVFVMQDVVDPFALASTDQLAAHVDLPLGEWVLLADLRHEVPPGTAQGRRDDLGANVALAQPLFVHSASFHTYRIFFPSVATISPVATMGRAFSDQKIDSSGARRVSSTLPNGSVMSAMGSPFCKWS